MPETLAPTPADTAVPSPIAVAIHHELSIGGPMTAEELLAALARRGLSVSGNDLEDLLDAGGVPHVVQLGMPDGPAFAALDSVLRGRVFTHRLTAREVAADVLTVEPDLKPLMILTRRRSISWRTVPRSLRCSRVRGWIRTARCACHRDR